MGKVVPLHHRAPPLLLPYQRKWIQDRSRVKVCEKSRRIGMTWATASHAVLEAGSGSQDVWYVSYNEDSAKEFILDCVKWCRWLGVAAGAAGEVILHANDEGELQGLRGFQIQFPSGKRISALTSRARNLRGKQGLVIIDEAAFHDDLPELLKAAFALLMWGGAVSIMSTHNGSDNAFARLCDEVRDGKHDYSMHKTTIQDALDQGLFVRICSVLKQPHTPALERAWLDGLIKEYGHGVEEELYCQPVGIGACYIGRPLIEARMIDAPVIRLERSEEWALLPAEERTREIEEWCEAALLPELEKLPANLPHAFGFDFGRYSDRTVLAPCTLQQNLVRRFPFLIEVLRIPHNQQWQIMKYVGMRLPGFFRCSIDAGGNGSWVAEQALECWGDSVVDCVDLSLRWYADNMPPFREAHEHRTIEYPRDLDVRNDVMMIRRLDGVPRIPKERIDSMHRGPKRHGDAAIALVLGLAATREVEIIHRRWDAFSG